ncbi:MAG TPA: YwbE family protein [Terriglobia bacterium]|nr:YwbE family protein [Terriglobia bacterium]
MDGQTRINIRPGLRVRVVEKQNQRTGKLTEGTVLKILTKSPQHPHGIKVMLDNGIVGRVKEILSPPTPATPRNGRSP